MKDIKDILTIVTTAVTPIVLAWIAYMQIKAGQKQKEIGVKVDGMTSKLVEAEKGKSAAEGELKGMAAVKAEIVIAPLSDTKVSLQDGEVKKVAETVVDTVKADPSIEIKKLEE